MSFCCEIIEFLGRNYQEESTNAEAACPRLIYEDSAFKVYPGRLNMAPRTSRRLSANARPDFFSETVLDLILDFQFLSE